MKLAKALKLKNRLAGEVGELKKRLASQNVRPKGQPFDYDNQQVLGELKAKIGELVSVKAAIARANAGIYDRIFRVAELRGLAVTLAGIESKQGSFLESNGYSPATETQYLAQLNKVALDREQAAVTAEIEAIQDELDEFNHARSIES